MRRALPLLLALSCVPTTAPPEAPTLEIRPTTVDKTLHGDTRFAREERWLFEYAAEALRRFSGGRIRLAIVWDYNEETFLDYAELPHIVRVNAAKVSILDARYHGSTRGYQVGNEIGIVAERCAEFYPVALHELAHFAGLDHVDAPGAVMFHASPSFTFKAADKAECQRVGLCEQ